MDNELSEISGSRQHQIEYENWLNKLEKMDDISVSRELYNRIMNHSDLSKKDKDLLSDAYEYCNKLMRNGKKLEPDLLRIYLEELKGYQISQVNMVNLVILLGCCGIVFTA